MIKYHILSHSIHEMAHIYTISEGLEHRLKKYINQATLESFMSLLKTKRFTYTHLQRILMQILLNVKKRFYSIHFSCKNFRNVNCRGQSYLKQLKPNFQSVNSSLILIKHLLIFLKMKLNLPIFITYYQVNRK